MTRCKTLVAVVALAVCASASVSFAGAMVPFPDWWSWPPGPPDPDTRLQYHSFITDPNLNLPPDWTQDGYPPSRPDVWTVPSSVAYNMQTGYPPGLFYTSGSPGVIQDLGDGLGAVMTTPGTISKDMGNRRNDEYWKELFACVIWFGPATATFDIGVTTEAGASVTTSQIDYFEPTMPAWRATVITGIIKPQPDWEVFDFAFGNFQPGDQGVTIEGIYVGTWCVPEPGTIVLLLGLFGAILLRRGR